MTDFYLMSGGDAIQMGGIAAKLGVEFLDKADRSRFAALGQQYHGKHVYVVDDQEISGRYTALDTMVTAAQAAGTESPRFVYFENPLEALQRFPLEKPDAVITDYSMKRVYGINGDELIRRMRELEKR